MFQQSYSIIDEWVNFAVVFLQNYGWRIVGLLLVLYVFKIPYYLSILPGSISDVYYGKNRKALLDKEVRRVRRNQQREIERRSNANSNNC